MKRLALLVGLLVLLASFGIFPRAFRGILTTIENIQAYPSDWPELSGMSESCAEIQGSFVDPNKWRWEREENPGVPLGAKYGGILEAAWVIFDLSAKDVRSQDTEIKKRLFNVLINPDRSLTVKYSIDNELVTSRSFTSDKLSCGQDGLTITIIDRPGVVLDKTPNEGHVIVRSTIYKQHGYLYVKQTNKAKTKILQVVPWSAIDVKWFRFPEHTQ